MPAEWESAPDRGLGPSVTHGWAAQPEWERSAAMVRRTLGQYVAVCLRLQLTSHTQPASRIKCESYIFIKVFVRSLKSSVCLIIFHIYMYMYYVYVCGFGVWVNRVSIPATGRYCLATLMSSDRTKQICLWMTIYCHVIAHGDEKVRLILSSRVELTVSSRQKSDR